MLHSFESLAMHSNPGSPTGPSFAKSTVKSKQKDKTDLPFTRRSRTLQTSQLPPDLPAALAAQLITVSSPRDILSAHLAGNDRRLRRLLCRYTNQIQHGCKNAYCTVPSCLTCRQRKSKTPIRKYTDVSARALAAHIIDEQGEDGLCHNDPVVPWFETPGSRSRTPGAERKPKVNGHVKESANGHAVGPANGHLQEFHQKSPSTKLGCNTTTPQKSAGEPRLVDLATKDGPSGDREPASTSVGTPESLKGGPAPPLRKDPKSFTQAIFDSLGLRSLWPTPYSGASALPVDPCHDENTPISQQEKLKSSGHDPSCQKNSDSESGFDHYESAVRSEAQGTDPESILPPCQHNSVHLQGFDHTRESRDDLKLAAGPRADTNQDGPWAKSARAAESGCVFDIRNRSGDPEPSIEAGGKSDSTDQELTMEATRDEHRSIQVAPFLSADWLMFFVRRKEGTLHNASVPWPDHLAPEPHRRFMENSVFFCLRNPSRTLQSIRDWHEAYGKGDTYDSNRFDRFALQRGMSGIAHVTPMAEAVQTMRLGLTNGFNPSPTWEHAASNRRKHSHKTDARVIDVSNAMEHQSQNEWLSNEDTARLCAFGLLMLEFNFTKVRKQSTTHKEDDCGYLPFGFIQSCNKVADILPEIRLARMKDPASLANLHESSQMHPSFRRIVDHVIDCIDYFDDYDAKRLFTRIVDLVAARHASDDVHNLRRKAPIGYRSVKRTPNVAALVAEYLISYSTEPDCASVSRDAIIITIEWTRSLFIREWDGRALVRRTSPLGGSLQLLMAIFTASRKVALDATLFHIPLLADRLDMVEMPAEWFSLQLDNKHIHLLSYSFLFEPQVLVSYFRAINFHRMLKATIDARAVQKDVQSFTDSARYPQQTSSTTLTALRPALTPHMANNFVITIRRDNLLQDAIDQVWRRQPRELMRPLKVRMGMDEGEQGMDIGGVQQEFFRVLFAQALNPEYAMFTVDERSRMTWFKAGTLEPLYKFEMLGLFMSLAVYNSITLPVTFPLAFYRRLLGLKVKKVHQIADGWTELARGLQQMLDWSEGDVSDVFARTYEFSYEAFGKHVNIDMKKFDRHTPWPPLERKKGKEKAKTASFELPPDWDNAEESLSGHGANAVDVAVINTASTNNIDGDDMVDEDVPLVTNADREQFVTDYITWLTQRSIEPQYTAFAKGFYTCLDTTALSIFTPEALKTVVEGYTDVDVDGLQAATTYEDGFDEFSSTIQDFWHIVRSLGTHQHRQLLAFVTASDRVPVKGIQSVQFIIQRNGSGDERLPTSMTCFGRLLLPQYSSRAVLEEKLTKAIENSEGFGMA